MNSICVGCIVPGDGTAFSFALGLLGLSWLENSTSFSSTTSPSTSFFFFSVVGFFDLSVSLVAKDSLVCWVGAGLDPSGLPKNLLWRAKRQ